MKRLILVRHAKSSWSDPGQRDFDRPLNKRGHRSAGLIGAWLRDNGYLPDHALVSEAMRTRETWDGITAETGNRPVEFSPDLYHADAGAIMSALRAAPEVPALLLLAHQPGIGDFASRAVSRPPEDAEFHRYPTAATTIIEFPAETWSAIAWSTGDVAAFIVPRRLEAA